MKENDLILNILANPSFTLEDFKTVGLTSDNTGLQSEDKYLQSNKIQQISSFKDANNNFDKAKFHNFYLQASAVYNQLSTDDYDKKILEQAQYSKDNIWVSPEKRTIDYRPKLVKRANPDLVNNSLDQFGQMGNRTMSVAEIAQTQKIVNPFTGEKSDSPNDSFFSNYFNTLVLAQYDEDVIDPKTKQVIHEKGSLKYNEDGLPYYEELAGRDVHGRQVLNKMDVLTTDGSVWNKFDFFDSDDINQKGLGSSLLKNAALVGSMFIPYVGPVITGLSVATQTTGLLATLGKLVAGNENKTLNNIQGWAKSVNRQNSTEYAQNNTWCAENFINMIGDTIGQLAEQRWIFKAGPALFKGKDAYKAMSNEGYEALKAKKLAELNAASNKTMGEILKDGVSTKNGLYYQQFLQAQQGANANKAALYVDDIVRQATKIGSPISKAYMVGITVQDTYGDAKAAGASDLEAALLTMGYAAGESWILNTGLGEWILPELHIDKYRNKAIAEALHKGVYEAKQTLAKTGDKKGFINKMLSIGKDIYTNTAAQKALIGKGASVVGAHALGEAFEETSEELLADASKAIFNVTRWLRGEKALDFWEGDNAFDRYTMSALGGLIGGGLTSAATNFRQVSNLSSMSRDTAIQQLLYMSNNGQLGDFIKDVDKMTIADKNKSATKIIQADENGVVYAEGTKDDNQDLAAKQEIKNICKFIDDVLTTKGAKISTDSLISKLTYEDQMDLVKQLKINNIAQSNVIGSYLQNYQNLQQKLIEQESKLHDINFKLGDVKSNQDPELVKQQQQLQVDIDVTVGKLKQYLDGTISPDVVRDAVFGMNPLLSSIFIPATFSQYVSQVKGKDIKDLSDQEQKDYWKEFSNYYANNGKIDTHIAAQLYQDMMELSTPTIQQYAEAIRNSNQDQDIKTLETIVNNYLQDINTPTTDSDSYIQKLESTNKNLGEATAFALLSPYLSESDRNILQAIDSEQNPTPEHLQEKANILNNLFDNNILNILEKFTNQEFIHPETKQLLLNTTSNLIARYGNLKTAAEEEAYNTGNIEAIDSINAKYVPITNGLQNIQIKINNLPSTPIFSLIDKFKMDATKSKLSFTEHWQQTMDLLEQNKDDLSEFRINGTWEDHNTEALQLVQSLRAVLEGMKVDNADINNPTGYTKILNTLYQKQGRKDFVQLAEISSDEANMMIADLNKIIGRLTYAEQLNAINKGQKLKQQSRVAANKNYLVYDSAKRLLNAISDSDWKEIDGLKTIIETIPTELKDAIENKDIKITKELQEQLNEYIYKIDNAIYDFFQANLDSDGKINKEKLGRLLHNFAGVNGFFQKTNGTLNETTKYIDDNAFIWYIASRAALKASDFYGSYKQAISDDIAPIASQELPIYLGVASITNMDVLNTFVDAYRDTVVQDFNNLTEDERKKVISNFDKGGDAYAKEFLQYFSGYDALPQYKNMIFIEGIAGSGKSMAVFKSIVRTIATVDPKAIENSYYVHETSDSAKNASEAIGLKGKTFSRIDFLKFISDVWKDCRDNKKKDTHGITKNYLYEDSYEITDNGQLKNKWAINKIADPPRLIFIDEISHYNQQEISMIEQWANEHHVVVITAGDFNQDTLTTYFNNKKLGTEDTNVTLNRNNFIRTPKLGVSLRTRNKQLTTSTNNTQLAVEQIDKGERVGLTLNYLANDPDHVGLFGVKAFLPKIANKITKEEVESLKDIIELMASTTENEKIGYIYHDENSELYKFLTTNYADKIDPKKDSDAQGLEGKYYIVEANTDSSDKQYIRSLYTGITRASQGVLAIVPSQLGNIDSIASVEDNVFQLETLGDAAIQKAAEERREQLDKLDTTMITEIKTPNKTTETQSISSPGTLPPPIAPPTTAPINVGVTKTEAQVKADELVVRTQNCDAIKDNTTYRIDSIGIEQDIKGNWEVVLTLMNNDSTIKVTQEDFEKEFTLQDKTSRTTKPLYSIGSGIYIKDGTDTIFVTIQEYTADNKYILTKPDGNTIEKDETELKAIITNAPLPPTIPSTEVPDTGVENATTFEYQQLLTNTNRPIETTSLLGLAYSFNTYNPGMINKEGKAIFDDNTPEAKEHFERRIDNFIGLMHILKGTADYDSYDTLDRKLSYIRNELFFNKDNASILNRLRRNLHLSGKLKIQYALKSTAGRLEGKDPKWYRYDQGENERLSYLHSDDENADIVPRKTIVAIISQDDVPILEIPTVTLNSPLTIIQRVNKDNQPLYPEILNTFLSALAKYKGEDNTQDLAIQEVIDKQNGKVNAEQQRIIELFKIFRFTSNGIFFFKDGFNLANQNSTGIQLTYAKGEHQINGTFVSDNKFVSIEELSKNKQLSISRIMISRNGMVNGKTVVRPGHSFVLVGNSNNYKNTHDLYQQFAAQQSDPNKPKEVELFYVLPPKASVSEWLENQHNLGLKATGLSSPEVFSIGNDFTGYRILSILNKEIFDKYPSKGSVVDFYFKNGDLNTIKNIVNQGKQIETKWQQKELSLDNSNTIGGIGEKDLYQRLLKEYTEKQVRQLMSLRELKQFLNKSPNLLPQGDRTNNQILNAYLACMVWNRNSETETVKNEEALKAIEETCKNNDIDGIFYKVQYSNNEVGEFTEIQQLDNYKLKGTISTSNPVFRINARIDTPAFNTDTISFQEITNQMYYDESKKVWKLKYGDAKTKENWYLSTKTNPVPTTSILDTYRKYTDNGIFTESEVLSVENEPDQKEALIKIYNAKGQGRLGFVYNDQMVFTQNEQYSDLSNIPTKINTTDTIKIQAYKNGKPVTLTFSFETDASGNINKVLANETYREKVNVTQQGGVDKELFDRVRSQIKIPTMYTKFKFWKYLADENGLEALSKLTSVDLRAVKATVTAYSKALKGDLKQDFANLVAQISTEHSTTINLTEGDRVYQNGIGYTIIKDNTLNAVDDNGNKVTLKEDNLEKEITPCNPINWKIKL